MIPAAEGLFLTLIVPAYNEAKSIAGTLDAAVPYLHSLGGEWEIIVAADGDDGTREHVASRHDERIRAIGHRRRKGKGRGIREAIDLAKGRLIGFMDADGKTPVNEADRLLPWFDQGYDLVIGSRVAEGSAIEKAQPRYRQIGARVFSFGMHAVVGLNDIRDTQCGFKFFRGEIAKDLFSRQRIDGYMFDVEVLYLAGRLGYRIKEVGVRWRDDGDSRLDLVSGNLRNLRDLLSIRVNHMRVGPRRR